MYALSVLEEDKDVFSAIVKKVPSLLEILQKMCEQERVFAILGDTIAAVLFGILDCKLVNKEVEKQRASFICRLLLQNGEAREFALRCCEIVSAYEETTVLELLTSEDTLQLLVSLTESDHTERDPETDSRVVQILANLA